MGKLLFCSARLLSYRHIVTYPFMKGMKNLNNYPWYYPLHSKGYNEMLYPHYWQWVQPNKCYQPYTPVRDYGNKPHAINIKYATKQNSTFRTAIWTGKHLQVTLMCINVGEDIGLEVHHHNDQFLRIESGLGLVLMGDQKDQLTYQKRVEDGSAIFVPAGKWHNIINTGHQPIKLYAIYAPPEHALGTIHLTKADAIQAEKEHD